MIAKNQIIQLEKEHLENRTDAFKTRINNLELSLSNANEYSSVLNMQLSEVATAKGQLEIQYNILKQSKADSINEESGSVNSEKSFSHQQNQTEFSCENEHVNTQPKAVISEKLLERKNDTDLHNNTFLKYNTTLQEEAEKEADYESSSMKSSIQELQACTVYIQGDLDRIK